MWPGRLSTDPQLFECIYAFGVETSDCFWVAEEL